MTPTRALGLPPRNARVCAAGFSQRGLSGAGDLAVDALVEWQRVGGRLAMVDEGFAFRLLAWANRSAAYDALSGGQSFHAMRLCSSLRPSASALSPSGVLGGSCHALAELDAHPPEGEKPRCFQGFVARLTSGKGIPGRRCHAARPEFSDNRQDDSYRFRAMAKLPTMTEPTELPARPERSSAEGGATQLEILLSVARSMVEEELQRSERFDSRAHNQMTIVAAFFAVVQTAVIALLNGRLEAQAGTETSAFVPWLIGTAGLAALALIVAVLVIYGGPWRLRQESAMSMHTVRDYIDFAIAGHPGVGISLIRAYADIGEDRRARNNSRAQELAKATIACALTIVVVGIELVLAFVAVLVA